MIQENTPVAQFEIGDYKNFVYLILDWNQKAAAIVDPQHDLRLPLSLLKKHEFTLQAVLLTHTHPDHVAGVPELVRDFPHLPIYLHRDDLHRLPNPVTNQGRLKFLKDSDMIQVGNLNVRVMHTPGHSAGECCFYLECEPPHLFTGDTLFIRDCGRTDFETGSNEEMFRSLQRLKKLPPKTVILPGHHYQEEYTSTLEKELRTSPPLQCNSVEELANLP